MFLVMPGDISDNIADSSLTDFNKLKVAIYKEREQDEVLRLPLHECGDGAHNKTAFEDCDYARVPPAGDLIYPNRQNVFNDNGYFICTHLCLAE